MTTERELQETKRRLHQVKQKNKKNTQRFIWFSLVAVAALLSLRNQALFSPRMWQITNSNNPLIFPQVKPDKIGSAGAINKDFSLIDKQALALRYQGSSVDELAKLLSVHAKTDWDKARIIYTWIAHNIDYDVDAFLTGRYGDLSPEGVLKSRRSVCSGYSELYQALATKMDLKTVVIEGYAKGVGYGLGSDEKANHAWNGVKINGAWYLVDATWGAGGLRDNVFHRQFKPFYFAANPKKLIYSHFPVDSAWQLLEKPYTKKQFDALKRL